MNITKIIKRDGTVSTFEREKIESSISKAFVATSTAVSMETYKLIADNVIAELDVTHVEINPTTQTIGDMVEKHIAGNGYFDVAKVFILYRNEKRKIDGGVDTLNEISVIKRDGSRGKFNINEVRKALKLVMSDSSLDIEGVLKDVKNGIYQDITTREINELVVMALRARIELEPSYTYVASRFLFNDLYKEVLGVDESDPTFEKKYRDTFEKNIKKGVKGNRYDKDMLDFDFAKLSKAFALDRDRVFAYMGAQTLLERYFMKDNDQNFLELPQYFWMRIAMGLALDEKNKEEWAIKFYNLISQLFYVPSTPTLFHAGTSHAQMSSCYLTYVADDLHHIFKSVGDNAQLAKFSGGIGNDFSALRATGSPIKSINVSSQGTIPFIKVFDSTTAAINRSGKRRGATAVYLESWHYDIEEFLELRKNTGDERRRTPELNTANWIPDLFMKRVMEDGIWTLFSPDETPELHEIYGKAFEEKYLEYEKKAQDGKIYLFKRIAARDLWRKMITMLFETGHAWMTWKDAFNLRSPQDHVGVIHHTNLCTEISLNTSVEETAVCNLGSINLSRYVTEKKKLDTDRLMESTKIAMRMLDNIIDRNFYPTKEAETANLRHRPVGLGIMGLQDMFYMMDINFDSEQALKMSDEVMEFISYYAIEASSDNAKEKGPYKSFKGSKWSRGIFPVDTLKILEEERGLKTGIDSKGKLDWKSLKAKVKKYGMRNSNCMAIAPTATISTISGSYPSIEPIYNNLYTKSNQSGEFTVVNQYLVEDLKKLNLWSKEMLNKIKYFDGNIQNIVEIPVQLREKYKGAFDIDPMWVIQHAARRGKWIDQSQSLNIFTKATSGKYLSDLYMNAWKAGLKSTYYLRTLGASSIEKSTIDINQKYEEAPPVVVEVPTAPVADFTQTTVQACRLDDPTCESCQ